ncbi:MAG: CPBP family intramembrane metalloprotease [Firmicutes bacterium]|nr:CPBP family intramembrane metalloprotease [Bacillota bacterium]
MPFYVFVLASMIFKVGFQEWRQHNDEMGYIDLGDVIIIGILATTRLVAGVDPVEFYGFRLADLRSCPWGAMAGIWAAAFALNRVVRARVPRELLPDGIFQLLGRYGLSMVATAGIPFVATQTLWEELLFRGVIFNSCISLLGVTGETMASCITIGFRDARFAAAAFASSAMFGLAHFLPLYIITSGRITPGKGRPGYAAVPGGPGKSCRDLSLARAYAFVMPCVYGLIFIELNARSGSLMPGWVMHFGLNYASLIWNRVWLGGHDLWMKATLNSRA